MLKFQSLTQSYGRITGASVNVMCRVTRYPAAYPLQRIIAKSVVHALSQFIFGLPPSYSN